MKNEPHIGKNWRDFLVASNNYVDMYDLRIGDYFMEDTYPEVYRVTRVEYRDGKSPVVLTHDITDDVKDVEWFYDGDRGRAYAPVLVKLEPK